LPGTENRLNSSLLQGLNQPIGLHIQRSLKSPGGPFGPTALNFEFKLLNKEDICINEGCHGDKVLRALPDETPGSVQS